MNPYNVKVGDIVVCVCGCGMTLEVVRVDTDTACGKDLATGATEIDMWLGMLVPKTIYETELYKVLNDE